MELTRDITDLKKIEVEKGFLIEKDKREHKVLSFH